MVALNEKPRHKDTTTRSSKCRAIESAQSKKSVDVYNLQRLRITDQIFITSDDLLIDQCSLIIERNARNRNYSPSLGRWINQDPASYINGANTYQFVESNPAGNVYPEGTLASGVKPYVQPSTGGGRPFLIGWGDAIITGGV